MIQFPKNFFWGSATSSYQVEGNNSNADWWQWEIAAGKERSAGACGHYDRYERDFDLIKSLNHNAHRLSIEWSRVEPKEGEFSQSELDHYVSVVKALRARGIEPMVTLHHFTNPIWFSQSGSWVKSSSIKRFQNYCDVVVKTLAPYVRYWFTINEPTVYFSHSFLWGMWPPQAKSFLQMKAVHDHMNEAHIQVYRRIHQTYKEMDLPTPMVSIAQHMQAIVACTGSGRDRWARQLREYWYNLEILDKLANAKTLDFIGVNYYSRHLVHTHSWWIGNLLMETCQENHHPLKKNFLNWDIYPDGLRQVLVSLKKYNVPVIISENGICTEDDAQRWEYIQTHLKAVHEAMAQGVDVQGYLYWSLMDNFEWAHGYGPRFGLIDLNYATQERTLRPSALKFAKICQTGVLD
jgi:beta-glucosidase